MGAPLFDQCSPHDPSSTRPTSLTSSGVHSMFQLICPRGTIKTDILAIAKS